MLSVPIGIDTDAAAVVAVARDPSRASIEAMLAGPRTLNTAIILPAGRNLPDALGADLMVTALKGGGVAFLVCEQLADALKAADWCRAAAGGDA
jgi:hypothetical protein